MTKRYIVEAVVEGRWRLQTVATFSDFFKENAGLPVERKSQLSHLSRGETTEWNMGAGGVLRITCVSDEVETYGDLAKKWVDQAVDEYLSLRRNPDRSDEQAIGIARSSISILRHVADIALADFDNEIDRIQEDDLDYVARMAGADAMAENRKGG